MVIKQSKLVGYFISDQQSDFYQSSTFMEVMQFAQQNPTEVKIKEKQTRNGLRLLMTFEDIETVEDALFKMKPLG